MPKILEKFGDADDAVPEGIEVHGDGRLPRPTKRSLEDEQELVDWLATGEGQTKSFQVGNDRRKYLHKLIDSGKYGALQHTSTGEGRCRTLHITKAASGKKTAAIQRADELDVLGSLAPNLLQDWEWEFSFLQLAILK